MKIQKTDLLFYSSYIFLYISLFLGDIYDPGVLDGISRFIRLISYGLVVLYFFFYKSRARDFLKFTIILAGTLLYGFKTGDLYWSTLFILIYCAKQINIDSIFNISSKILMSGITIVLICCAFGLLPDVITARDSINTNEFIRHSLGFYHSNVLPLLVFYLEVYYIFMRKNKVKKTVISLFLIIALSLNIICNSRNAFFLCLFLSVFVLYEKFVGVKATTKRILSIVTKYSVPVMAIFSGAMMYLLLKGGIWEKVDAIFSGRFRLAIFKMRRVGLHLINFMSNESFIRDNITYVNGKELDSVVLDNGYLYVMLRYGILILLFYFVLAILLSNKAKNNTYVLVVFLAVFVANFVDNDLVDYSFLPFILVAFNNFGLAKKNDIGKTLKNKKKIRFNMGGKVI